MKVERIHPIEPLRIRRKLNDPTINPKKEDEDQVETDDFYTLLKRIMKQKENKK